MPWAGLFLYEDRRHLSAAQTEKLLSKFSKYDLLIIDKWLMEDLSKEEIHFVFELIERRYDSHSMIFCTQCRKEDWLDRLGSDVHAEAITDHIIHNAIWINMGSRNMREKTAPNDIKGRDRFNRKTVAAFLSVSFAYIGGIIRPHQRYHYAFGYGIIGVQ